MRLKIRKVKNYLFKKPISAPRLQYTKTVSNAKIITLKDSKTQVKDITPNMRNILINGKVEKVNEIRDFVRKDGSCEQLRKGRGHVRIFEKFLNFAFSHQ